jgi:ADP-ribosylglycohydrolase/O-acetyl-ADP-ribose deacetylase (regulator of RNase III)
MRRGIVRWLRRRGAISDDTQQTVCVARSFAGGVYLHERFIDELRLWHGFRIGAGRASSIAARRLRGDPAAASGVASEGNGAAMRVLPFAVVHARRDAPDELLRDVEQNARATHTSPVAVAAAKLYALLAWRALRMPAASLTGASLSSLVPALASTAGCAQLQDGAPVGPPRRPPSGHAAESLTAVVQLLAVAGLDFEDAMRRAFFAGGDVDTVAAMVGGIVGAQLGLSALPQRWVKELQHRDAIVALAARLLGPAPPRHAAAVVEVDGDVATRDVDVVVNAWNRNILPSWMLVPSGVSGAIRRAGGAQALREISRRGPMPLGAAWETVGFGLRARWVIHVAGIDLTWRASERSVRWSTRHALLLARTLGAATIALPLIGAGTGGLSPEQVRAWMLEEIRPQAWAFDRVELVRRVTS